VVTKQRNNVSLVIELSLLSVCVYANILEIIFQVKVTEIVDVTDAGSSAVLSPEERANNMQLEFDDDWLSQQVMQTDGQYNHF
jgi:hypothetical protein